MSGHYFISDVHLGRTKAKAVNPGGISKNQLADFLEHLRGKADSLYILGDLFEFWFEFREVMPKAGWEILTRLTELYRSGTKLFLFRGNHDVWFKGTVERTLGVKEVYDELATVIDGLRVYLAHGDQLDKSFISQAFRILMHNRFNAGLFSLIHPDIGVALARRVAGISRSLMIRRGVVKLVQERLADFAQRKIAEGFDVVIFGHTHIPEIRRFGQGVYLNLGDWLKSCSYGIIKDGKVSLEEWRSNF